MSDNTDEYIDNITFNNTVYKDSYEGDKFINSMINEKIVDIEVDKIGISVSKERLRNSIFASPYFKDQLGQFSQEQFEYNLRQLGLDEKEFLKELSKTIKRDQINNIFSFEKK